MARSETDWGFRSWLREAPVAAIILTGVAGGAGVGTLVGIAFLNPIFLFFGLIFGVIGGTFATGGALLARAIIRLFTKAYGWEAPTTVGGAIGGILVASLVILPDSWQNALPVILICAAFAGIGFTVLAILRRPQRDVVDPDSAWEDDAVIVRTDSQSSIALPRDTDA